MIEAPSADDRRSASLSGGDFVQWECPLCGRQGIILCRQGDGEREAVEALLSHARSSSGGVHGPLSTVPDGLDDGSLSEHVERPNVHHSG